MGRFFNRSSTPTHVCQVCKKEGQPDFFGDCSKCGLHALKRLPPSEQESGFGFKEQVQTKSESLLESCANVVIGFALSMLINAVVFPQYGIHVTTWQSAQITIWFTILSIGRSYVIRRVYATRAWKRIFN